MALEVAANLGVAPRECLFVGDSTVDIQTAKAANMPIVAMTYGFNSEEKLLSEKHQLQSDLKGAQECYEKLVLENHHEWVELDKVYHSKSFLIMKPFRETARLFKNVSPRSLFKKISMKLRKSIKKKLKLFF